MNTSKHALNKYRRLLSFINQLISWYILTFWLSWSGCQIFPPATSGARFPGRFYSWVKKKGSTLKAASIRSLPAWKGMTDVLASTPSLFQYLFQESFSCQAWMKWYLINLQMEYGEYMAIHFPIVAQIKRNWGTGKYDQVQFTWINCHRILLTIMKSPLKFASLSTLNPCVL